MKTIIWHGSPNIIEQPVFGRGSVYNDYGSGFYCTKSRELAKEWACTKNADGYANQYELDLSHMKILDLLDEQYNILNWLALLVDNRIFNASSAVARQGIDYLKTHFLPDTAAYDIIRGYRADDSYFSFAKAFVNNSISLSQLQNAMYLGELGEQIVLKSEKAFEAIRYIGYEPAENIEYFVKRITRDEQAREKYARGIEVDDIDGIYMRDIIRERMENDDSRL